MFYDDKMMRLHFSECWDENIWIDENEGIEWLKELQSILNDNTVPVQQRLQKVIDEITSTV